MHEASVQCDLCGETTTLENFNGKSSYRMPDGWVTVGSHITLHGKPKDRWELKDRVKEMFPSVHLCPTCTEDPKVKEKREREMREISKITEPRRRVLQIGE